MRPKLSYSNSKTKRCLYFESPFNKGGLRGDFEVHKILPGPPLEKQGIKHHDALPPRYNL
jgi:hypothetical protein